MRLVISIIVLLFFTFRERFCVWYFPDMKTVTGEWDASNDLTMNTFSLLFCLTFLFGRLGVSTKKEKLLWDIIIGISISDVADRVFFDINHYTKEDIGMLAFTIMISYLDVFTKYNVEWITKKVQSLWMKSLK